MTPAFLSARRAELEAKRTACEAAIRAYHEGLGIETEPGDPADHAQAYETRDRAAIDIRRVQAEARAVVEALERIQAGTYGLCDCGAEISEKRLKALPAAETCITCAEARNGRAA